MKIHLEKHQYEKQDYESYSLPAFKIDEVVKNDVPEILLPFDEIKNIEGKPVVAIMLSQIENSNYEKKDYFSTPFYPNAVMQAGGYPVFISYEKIKEQLDMANPDAILLVGGRYDLPNECVVKEEGKTLDLVRHKAYQEMIAYAHAHKLPLLGICGGEQALAVYYGAKVISGINADKERIKINHRPGGANLEHTVGIDENSTLFRVVKENNFMVTSVHNYAVSSDYLGDVKVVATASDGIVEAVEPKNPWCDFVIGVQWHPERWATKGDKPSVNLFKAFIESAKQK